MAPEPEAVFPLDRPVPRTFDDALRGIVNREFLMSERHQKQHWRADRRGLHPDLLEFEQTFRARMAKLGVPVFVAEAVRSPERQNDLYALGNSRARGGQSAHQFGCAVDIVHGMMAWNMDPKAWKLFGHVGKEIIAQRGLAIHSLAWGGDWSFWDPAHWEVKDWRNIKGSYPNWPPPS